ncbi:ferrous iron transport protein B [candidate division KSB1 bacterium RBG_16_48_16]|nr:MAG: ferrous iron transport protein B [candidate division KSB1 bacterium RBG_16_48_16]
MVLVGQPNCGKSTIFNSVAGYKSVSTNFPGATVKYAKSHVRIIGHVCDLVDLPGIYSLTSSDPAAEEAKTYLLTRDIDVIINVADASLLSRSLELTIQLLELNIPMLLCLNMMDEANRKGIIVHLQKLSKVLHIPVAETIGSHGHGIKELFTAAFHLTKSRRRINPPLALSKHVEEVISQMQEFLERELDGNARLNYRLYAIKLLEDDPYFTNKVIKSSPSLIETKKICQQKLSEPHGHAADIVISSERHSLAMNIFEKVAVVRHAKKSLKDSIDNIIMHPFWGYVIMLSFLYLFFNAIFKIGEMTEGPLLSFFENTISSLANDSSSHALMSKISAGVIQGIAGGIGIVLPYLFPFLLGMAIIEDIGYLPRIAFLMDSFMHKVGLHGSAVIPGMLGFGCSVPAVMATRILPSPRDRFIASTVSVLIPCSARMTVIFGLVGYYLGGTAALAIYLLNIIVISITGAVISKLLPEDTPGMVMEMPTYQRPQAKIVLLKTWLRIKDFVYIAWPLLIVGSLVLSIAEWYHVDNLLNQICSPLTDLLGLPAAVGTTLFFGILRKELSMLMLFQALGTSNVNEVLTPVQIFVFTLFIVFYIPCLATIGVLVKETGWQKTLFTVGTTILISLSLATSARFVAGLFLNP